MRTLRSIGAGRAPAKHTTDRRHRPSRGERAAPSPENAVRTSVRPHHATTRCCDRDPYATWDAAYVLGSLSADDRREYEAHMSLCRNCRDVVADLSVIPAWLALLDRIEAAGPAQQTSRAAGPNTHDRCRRPKLWRHR